MIIANCCDEIWGFATPSCPRRTPKATQELAFAAVAHYTQSTIRPAAASTRALPARENGDHEVETRRGMRRGRSPRGRLRSAARGAYRRGDARALQTLRSIPAGPGHLHAVRQSDGCR